MNKIELKNKLCNCFTADACVEVYLGIKDRGFKKARFEKDVQKVLKTIFQKELDEKLLNNEDVNLIPYSSYEDRTKDWAEYDLDMPENLNFFEELMRINEVQNFSFEDDGLDNIESMVIVIGNAKSRVGIYKRVAKINIYTKNTGLFVRKGDNGFVTGNINFLRITNGIDMVKIADSLIIANLSILEKYFNITDIIFKAANKEINSIAELDIINDTTKLIELTGDIRYARKLTKISEVSPVIKKGITSAQIKKFVTSTKHPLMSSLRFDEKDRICLNSKKSAKVFIKLLNDDYLLSELTDAYYDSAVKEELYKAVEQ